MVRAKLQAPHPELEVGATTDATALDVQAACRDVNAAARDREAATRDRFANARDDTHPTIAEPRSRPGRDRDAAGRDRTAASLDRIAAASDRVAASLDRERSAEYRRLTYRDELTQVLQRRSGRDQLAQEVQRAHRQRSPLVVIFLDVDHLKQVNDATGHADGDDLLHAVGLALLNGLRTYDTVVRYGGDEFICALPGATLADVEVRLAAVHLLLAASRPHDSISAGLAELRPAESLDSVIGRADAALYEGRQRPRRR